MRTRPKNAAYRRSKVSDATFQFLLFYLSKYREFLQHQPMLFVNIEGETKGKALQVDAVYRMLERMEKKTGIHTTIKYLNLVDDQLMEASDQYYAKHSALYDVEKLL